MRIILSAVTRAIVRMLQQVDGYTPGVDYPIYNTVPYGLAFTCGGKLPGYYADPEARCQVRLRSLAPLLSILGII